MSRFQRTLAALLPCAAIGCTKAQEQAINRVFGDTISDFVNSAMLERIPRTAGDCDAAGQDPTLLPCGRMPGLPLEGKWPGGVTLTADYLTGVDTLHMTKASLRCLTPKASRETLLSKNREKQKAKSTEPGRWFLELEGGFAELAVGVQAKTAWPITSWSAPCGEGACLVRSKNVSVSAVARLTCLSSEAIGLELDAKDGFSVNSGLLLQTGLLDLDITRFISGAIGDALMNQVQWVCPEGMAKDVCSMICGAGGASSKPSASARAAAKTVKSAVSAISDLLKEAKPRGKNKSAGAEQDLLQEAAVAAKKFTSIFA